MTIHTPALGTPAAAFAARYGAGAEPVALWNATIASILGHRSVRAYRPDPVPEGTVELALAAAQSAPSSSNLQPWRLVAIEDPARRARIEALAGPNPQINEAPLLLVWVADLSRLRALAGRSGTPGAALDYLESFLLASVDTALAAQSAVVALESIGLGTCFIGAIRNDPEAIAVELGLPPEAVAIVGLAVGHPDPDRPASVKPRLAPAAVLSRDAYAAAEDAGTVARYDAVIGRFQEAQGQPNLGWSGPVATRIGSRAALRGRHRLAEALRKLGFRLG